MGSAVAPSTPMAMTGAHPPPSLVVPSVPQTSVTRMAAATALASAAERRDTTNATVLRVEALLTEPASHAAKLATASATVLTVEVLVEPATHAVNLATRRRIVPAAEALTIELASDAVMLAIRSATALPPLVDAKRASTAAWRGKL